MDLVGRYSNRYAYLEPLLRLKRLLSVATSVSPNDRPLQQPHKITQRMSPDQIRELISAYETGVSVRELGRQYGLSHSTVTQLLETQGVELRQRGLSESHVAKATELYASGLSLAVIGKQLDQNPASVRDALVRAGVQMRRPHKLTSEEIAECVRLYDEGWSTVRLGKRFGVGDRTVAKALRKADVRLRQPGPSKH